MHLSSSVMTFIGAVVFLVVAEASSSSSNSRQVASNLNHLNPSKATLQIQRGDIQPVAYIQNKAGKHHNKRDYETTLQYLRAAINSYKRSIATPLPVELIQLEKIAPPAVADATIPPPPEVVPSPDLEVAPPPELGNEITESTAPPPTADIEEDDSFDPEEDPDDVGDPPVVNGVAVDREE